MIRFQRAPLFYLLVLLAFVACSGAAAPATRTPVPAWRQPAPDLCPNLFVWTDTCNVYALREGDAALLIDLGDGSACDHLDDIGVKQIDWVLFTHHHREQCQGAARLAAFKPQIAAPEAERALFERPADFRKMKVRLGDAFTIHGSSYVRPPIQPIRLDRGFAKTDVFTWRGREFWCVETRGNSPGAMSYLLKIGERWLAFSGDVMLAGAKWHTWFDSEWDYGFAAGLYALHNSAALLASFDPAWLLPSHGPAIRQPRAQLRAYTAGLRRLEPLYLRGYGVSTFSAGYQDKVSRPTAVPSLWQVSPHLFKFKAPDFFPNFRLPDLDLRRVKERRWMEGLINRAAGRGGAVNE